MGFRADFFPGTEPEQIVAIAVRLDSRGYEAGTHWSFLYSDAGWDVVGIRCYHPRSAEIVLRSI